MRSYPSGTVTFLFTDIEGSTRLSQQYSESMPALLARHNEILDQAITAHGGFTFHTAGDSYAVAFHNTRDALGAALDIQRALYKELWSPAPIKIRMGIHNGVAQLEDASGSPRYSGYTTLSMSQRVMSAGHGGQILLSQMAVDLISDRLPAEVQLKDMGEYRLKDIVQPAHLYQVVVPDLPFDFPPLSTEKVVNHNLPAQPTTFIGRETELAFLHALLSDSKNRLITIVAPGGMGKTRLSLEAAGQMIHTFPQGIYFVALDRITAADMIVQSVADVLPISLSSNEDPKSRIMDYVHDKKILFVMDNFEHVLEGATLVQDILTAAPQVQILTTSRLKLNLMGEMVFNIEGLTVSKESSAEDSAIQLFVQSVRQTLPGFQLSDSILPAATKICQLVDGMPLAIVLAAAWINTLDVDEIAVEIEKNVDMLETEKRDVPDRQRSVRAVIGSSWNQVDGPAQDLLARLSVFRGGFTRLAAQEAAGASLRGLSQLVEKALVRRDPHMGRYSIHELVRQYAGEQLGLSADKQRSAHENHATYFANFMKSQWVNVCGSGQKTALIEVGADFDNIRVAWNYWVDHQDAPRLVDFIRVLWIFFEVRGSFTPAIQFLEDAARRLITNEPDVVSARAELRAREAWFTALVGQPEQGLRLAQDSVNTLRHYNREISVNTLDCININAIFMNQIHIVIQTSQEMRARASSCGDIWEQGWASIWSAYAYVLQQQIREALQAGQDALAIFEKLDNPFGISVASGLILGITSMATGDKDTAKEYFLHGMRAAEEIKYLRLLQIIYDNLGTIALLEQKSEDAREFFLQSLRISQESGQTREMLASLRDVASVYIAQGDLETALQLLAVVLNHPASEQNSLNRPERLRDEADKLRLKIESQLDQLSYQTTWEASQSRHLAEAVNQILN
jgi:predicted ATPase/class 3 adenylate cyclase